VLHLVCLLLLPGQIETVDSAAFSKEMQKAAISATVRIVNAAQQSQGSGVLIGRKGPAVYILTAYHVVDGADRLEVAMFSENTYPRPYRVYRSGRLVAKADDMRDLALLRLITDGPVPEALSLCPARKMPNVVGFKALGVGCAASEAPTCLVEEVTGKERGRRKTEDKAAAFWEVDRQPADGRSGGPLVDQHGYLLGVCSGTNKEKSYFCHLDEVRGFLQNSGFDWLIGP
jgi:S1-C subfamily serine protease